MYNTIWNIFASVLSFYRLKRWFKKRTLFQFFSENQIWIHSFTTLYCKSLVSSYLQIHYTSFIYFCQ